MPYKNLLFAISIIVSLAFGDISWTKVNSGSIRNLSSIVWGSGKYVAIGSAGSTTEILNSSNGSTWNIKSVPYYLTQVIFADSQFVAIGNGVIYNSIDGSSWKKAYETTKVDLNAISTLNGNYVVIGDSINATHFSLISKDCIVWTKYLFWQYGRKLISNANKLIALYGDSQLMSSVDGVAWVSEKTPLDSAGAPRRIMRNMKYTNEHFFAIGDGGANLQSDNGVIWTLNYSSNFLTDVIWVRDHYIAVADQSSGSNGLIFSSKNGIDWTKYDLGVLYSETLNDITYGNQKYVAVGSNGLILVAYDTEPISSSSSNNYLSSSNASSSSTEQSSFSNSNASTISIKTVSPKKSISNINRVYRLNGATLHSK